MSQKDNLRDAITQILSCALQPNNEIQRLTEERKKALEMTEDYGFILLEIIQTKEEAIAEQMMAATFLKNYISDIYSPQEPVTLPLELKIKLTEELLTGLVAHENASIRRMIGLCLKMLLVRDLSHLFTLLNNRLMPYLLSDNMQQILGGVEFMKSLGLSNSLDDFDYETMYFRTEFIEPLLNILYNEMFPMRIRAATVSVLVHILVSCRRTQLFEPTLARLTEVFQSFLSNSYGPNCDYKLRSEIILGIAHAIISFTDNGFSELVTACLPAIGQIMNECIVECKAVIMERQDTPRDQYETEPANFKQLILCILILMRNVAMRRHYVSLLLEGLDDFVYLIFVLMCYGNLNESIFVEENVDIDPETDYTIRGRTSKTLMMFMAVFDFQRFCDSFHYAIQKHYSEIDQIKAESEIYYVRVFETLMYGLGLYSVIYETHSDNQFIVYIEHWSADLLVNAPPPHWMVLGRLLWLGARFSSALSTVTLTTHLRTIFSNHGSENAAVRFACLDAMRIHLSFLSENNNKVIFNTNIENICNVIMNVPIYSPVMACMSFQSLTYLVECFPESIPTNPNRFVQHVVDAVLSNIANVLVIKDVKIFLGKIVPDAGCKLIIKERFIPFTLELIYKNIPEPLNTRTDLPERGFDLLDTVIKYYSDPLEDDVVMQSFLAACNAVNELEDRSILEVATMYISNLIMKSLFQIQTVSDQSGKILASYMPEVIFKLLDAYPRGTMCPSTFGRMTVISIMMLPEYILPVLEPLLKALLSALQRTECFVALRNYFFVFAYMFTWQTEATTNFLNGIPGPDGKSALTYLLNQWQAPMLLGEKFERCITALGLCKMIEHTLGPNDSIRHCRVMLRDNIHCSGLEKLYLLLAHMLLNELQADVFDKFEDAEKCDMLIKTHPVYSIDLLDHIKGFIRLHNNNHWSNVVTQYISEPLAVILVAEGLEPAA